MEYKIKDVCNECNFGVSKFYKLKNVLTSSIPEQNRIEYFYNKGRNFFITDKGLCWFKNNSNVNLDSKPNCTTSDVTIYQNEIIDIYKKRIEYLENENKRLLDIISIKEQKEIAGEINRIDNKSNNNIFSKFFDRFKK